MKKTILSILAVMVMASVVHAAALSAPTTYGTFGAWKLIDTIAVNAADTVSGADTLNLIVKESFSTDFEWALMINLATEAADSLQFEYLAYDTRGDSLIAQAITDTVGASATGAQFTLPFGNTVLTSKATIRAIGWISGKKASIYRIERWGRQRGIGRW